MVWFQINTNWLTISVVIRELLREELLKFSGAMIMKIFNPFAMEFKSKPTAGQTTMKDA